MILKRSLLAILLLSSLCGCISHKELVNFNEAEFLHDSPGNILNQTELRIQPNDLIRITVHSSNEKAAAPFNIESSEQGGIRNINNQQGQGGGLELFTGYYVDEDGFIDFPILGQLLVAGKTITDAKTQILGLLSAYLTDPVVNMRFLNFKVTVLGEVNQPGTIRLTNKRVTVLEAIGMAGDLTDYADRNEVLVVREQAGERTTTLLNLKQEEIFLSPYFYLQQNDLIYVKPLRARVATVADPAQRIISYGTAALSLVTLIIALVR